MIAAGAAEGLRRARARVRRVWLLSAAVSKLRGLGKRMLKVAVRRERRVWEVERSDLRSAGSERWSEIKMRSSVGRVVKAAMVGGFEGVGGEGGDRRGDGGGWRSDGCRAGMGEEHSGLLDTRLSCIANLSIASYRQLIEPD